MKPIFALASIVLVAVVTATAPTRTTSRMQSIAFNHVTVVDMTGAPAQRDMTVVIKVTTSLLSEKRERCAFPKAQQSSTALESF